MRLAIVAATALLGTACFQDTTLAQRERMERRSDSMAARTVEGEPVIVQQDRRTGELVIVEPAQYRGQLVAVVDRDRAGGLIVTRDVRGVRRNEGSAGDAWHRDHDRDPDHDGDRH